VAPACQTHTTVPSKPDHIPAPSAKVLNSRHRGSARECAHGSQTPLTALREGQGTGKSSKLLPATFRGLTTLHGLEGLPGYLPGPLPYYKRRDGACHVDFFNLPKLAVCSMNALQSMLGQRARISTYLVPLIRRVNAKQQRSGLHMCALLHHSGRSSLQLDDKPKPLQVHAHPEGHAQVLKASLKCRLHNVEDNVSLFFVQELSLTGCFMCRIAV
jgi:hypothetical protein